MLLKGNREETCRRLLKDAITCDDPVAQIQLSRVYNWMGGAKYEQWSEYALRDFPLFRVAYEAAWGSKLSWEEGDAKTRDVFTRAAENGYLPARLELLAAQWTWHQNSYMFAVQLLPYVNRGDKLIDYYFGKALKGGSAIGSLVWYKGLYWMEHSLGVPVKYPRSGESLDAFWRNYIHWSDAFNTYFNHDGMWFVGPSVVLAPSEAYWAEYKEKKLSDMKLSNPDIVHIDYDPERLKRIADQYGLGAVQVTSFNADYVNSSLSIYSGRAHLGNISVRSDTFDLVETFNNPGFQPVLHHLEAVMKACGSAGSAFHSLGQAGARYW